ncbi:MAG: oligosaccharide flippase family protein [Candidatus Moranbacteria bacterium]|nr:oligosaccharide flippase family protein [Candidatus Moranbacteria bacterium]
MRRILLLFQENIFIRNSMVLFLGTMVVNVLNYIFHLMVGRMVDPVEYGEIESLLSLFAIISVPAGTLILLATKYAADMKAKNDFQGTDFFSRYLTKKVLLCGLPFLFFAIFLTPFVKNFLHIDKSLPLFFLWGAMFFSFLGATTSGVLNGWQKFFHTSLVGIFSTLLKVVAVFIFLQWGFSVSGVVGSYVLSIICVYAANFFLLKHFFQKNTSASTEQNPPSFSGVKQYLIPAFIGTLSLAILGNADMIFAQHHLESSLSGEYGALSVTAKTIFFVTGVLTTVLFAMSAEEHTKKKQGSTTFFLAFSLIVLVVAFSLAVFAFFPEFILSLFFGEKYLLVSPFLVWFALAAGLYSVANLLLQYLLSLQETKITVFFLILSLFEIVTLFFYGESMYAIISITIGVQIIAILFGFWFVLKRKNDYVEENFNSYSGIQ